MLHLQAKPLFHGAFVASSASASLHVTLTLLQAYAGDLAVGTIVCKQEIHRDKLNRGYLAMLSTREAYRGKGVGE